MSKPSAFEPEARWIALHRAAHPEWFTLLDDLEGVAHRLIESLQTPVTDQRFNIAAALLLRGLHSVHAASVLIERGLTGDALILARSALETVFFLAASLRDPDFYKMMIADENQRRRKMARVALRLPEAEIDFSPDIKERLMALAAEPNEKSAELRIVDVAQKGGLIDFYRLNYADLSNSAAHPSISALLRHVDLDSTGAFDGLYWGPDSRDILRALTIACTAAVQLLALWNESHGAEEARQDMSRWSSRYEQLIGLDLGAEGAAPA